MPRKVLTRRTLHKDVPEESMSDHASSPSSSEHRPASSISQKNARPALGILMVVILLTAGALMVKNGLAKQGETPKSKVKVEQKNETAESTSDVAELVKKVAAHITVNPDEMPTVATVNDAEALRQNNPVFYRDAQNGDRLLIWTDKAVLYSVSRDTLLSVLPVAVNASTKQASALPSDAQAKTEAVKIEVRNGSGVPGSGNTLASKLKDLGLEVLPASNAGKTPYPKTIIILKPGVEAPETLAKLQQATGASLETVLPSQEAEMKAEILVIVGNES